MSDDDVYEVYAIRYGHHARRSPDNFIGGDPHDILQPLDFFVWAIVGKSAAIIVDSGFDEPMAKRRQRDLMKPVGEGLEAIGVDPAEVEMHPGVPAGQQFPLGAGKPCGHALLALASLRHGGVRIRHLTQRL